MRVCAELGRVRLTGSLPFPIDESRWSGWRAQECFGTQRPFCVSALRFARSCADADALDLPFKFHAGMFLNSSAYRLAQAFDLGSARMATIDQEITMHLRYLRVADLQPAATGGVDQLPRFATRRIFECRAPGAALDGLCRFTRLGDLVHLRGDQIRIAGRSGEYGFGKN